MLRSNRFSLREFAAEYVKLDAFILLDASRPPILRQFFLRKFTRCD